ncbi:MAG TPA: magnesium/cobalt transporter CorA [Anaeromyxobacteraceae bacterium]|nr:magnesium/cobalt transporter CorA [Anaeromyxobacteraceae bacterium]
MRAVLVNCVAYQDGKKLADIEPEAIGSYVSRSECFVWVALKDPEPAEIAAMERQFSLHPLAVEDALHGQQRPKIEEYGDSLFAALHTLEVVEGEMRAGEVDIFVGRNYVLSVRTRASQGFADVRARCEREPELLRQGAGFVLYALMDAVVDRYFPVIEKLEGDLEASEERIFSGAPTRAAVEALYALKRQLTTLQHAVRPLLDATGKLFGGRVPPICALTQDYFRDVYDHLQRINQALEALRDMLATAMSVNLSLITLQENETTKRLASYAALVAVPTMIAGLYGMNFEHMPELHWPFGYPLALGLMVAIDAWLFWRFRRAGWL